MAITKLDIHGRLVEVTSIRKDRMLSTRRGLNEWIQYYLELDFNLIELAPHSIWTAIAIRQGVKLN